jgi:hypothetical protein
VYAQAVLADTAAVSQSGGAFVAGAGSDFRESIAHDDVKTGMMKS